ncbi:MAG: glycosyltransferase family 2 protein [Candidatus Schekmanbacteria bacterium]|nr:MAG: glycosyltransferase family 2 protein [Candidatus Schekmanbacteria bacterium]
MTGKNKKISAVVITFNEEENIEECLKSLLWTDEIIIVDSFSNDNTVEIAKRYTSKIYQKVFSGHIEQKNFALSLTNYEWIISLDADERISNGLKNEIIETINSPSSCNGYFIKRENYYLGKKINHSGWNPDYKLRLFKKEYAKWDGINPHDSISLEGKKGYLKNPIIHYTYKNLTQHFSQIDYFSSIGAKEYYSKKKQCRFYHLLLLPFITIFKKLIIKGAFLDGSRGIMISMATVFSEFLKYAKLWELNERERRSKKT